MQDSADKQTVDLFQSRRRGRPVTGSAMTNAERQRLYRQNLKNRNVTDIINNESAANDALVQELERWKNLFYTRDSNAECDLRDAHQDFNRKIAGQKAQVTKYRNENQALRDKIAFLERQLTQRNENKG